TTTHLSVAPSGFTKVDPPSPSDTVPLAGTRATTRTRTDPRISAAATVLAAAQLAVLTDDAPATGVPVPLAPHDPGPVPPLPRAPRAPPAAPPPPPSPTTRTPLPPRPPPTTPPAPGGPRPMAAARNVLTAAGGTRHGETRPGGEFSPADPGH